MTSLAAKQTLRELGREATDPLARSFLTSLDRSDHQTWPYDYWLLKEVLPPDDIEAVLSLPFAPPSEVKLDGRRESNNATRVFFNPENQARFAVCRRIVDGFGCCRHRGPSPAPGSAR